jgi:hypothetical protein
MVSMKAADIKPDLPYWYLLTDGTWTIVQLNSETGRVYWMADSFGEPLSEFPGEFRGPIEQPAAAYYDDQLNVVQPS